MSETEYIYPVTREHRGDLDDMVRISAEASSVSIVVLDEHRRPAATLTFKPITARAIAERLLTAADAASLMGSVK